MSYTLKVKLNLEHGSHKFHVVEKTVYDNGTWDNDGLTLTLGSSGTSGGLRLKNANAVDCTFVVLGIHDSKPWINIAVDLGSSETGVKVHPTYYAGGSRSGVSISSTCDKLTGRGARFYGSMTQSGQSNTYDVSVSIIDV